MWNFDLLEVIDASHDDGYNEIKNHFGGAKFDLDFKELFDVGQTLWITEERALLIGLKDNGNIYSITVSDFDEDRYEGYCYAYDRDNIGFAYVVMSALREFIRINGL